MTARNSHADKKILVTSENKIIMQSRVTVGKAIPGIGTLVEFFIK